MGYFSDTKGSDAQDPDSGVVASPESQAGMCFYVYTPQALYQYAVADPKRFSRLKEHWKDGAVLIVEHSYRSAEMVRDSDNVELKQAIYLLHFLGYIDSDRGTELNIFLTCNTTDQNKNETCLYLTPKACIQKFWD